MKLFIRRPELIDQIVLKYKNGGTMTKLSDEKWYISKCLPMYGIEGFFERCWHAWLVFTDKARAHEYMSDRMSK